LKVEVTVSLLEKDRTARVAKVASDFFEATEIQRIIEEQVDPPYAALLDLAEAVRKARAAYREAVSAE
jgi:hypothetical protein